MKKELVLLYLSVKVRKDVSSVDLDCSQLMAEAKNLESFSPETLIEYVKASFEIISSIYKNSLKLKSCEECHKKMFKTGNIYDIMYIKNEME